MKNSIRKKEVNTGEITRSFPPLSDHQAQCCGLILKRPAAPSLLDAQVGS